MLFQRFEVKGLSHYSYTVGCEQSKKLVIVDPKRDVDDYVSFAKDKGYRVSHVLETHIHADYASGAKELAEVTGAELCLSAYDKGEKYVVSYAHRSLKDGDSISFPTLRLTTRHTPGHTPEHISFLVYDLSQSAEKPVSLLSGDFLFVGSIGRPDLLGDQATERLVQALYQSTREILAPLADEVTVYPAHGAGSLCGASIGRTPSSTLGEERQNNRYLRPTLTREEFISTILISVPPRPPYYLRMKEVNARGPISLGGLPGDTTLSGDQVQALITSGAVVIDLRDQQAFGAGHIPNAFGIGAGNSLAVWAPWVVPYDRPIVLVAAETGVIKDAIRSLIRVGFDDVKGYLEGGMDTWTKQNRPTESLQQISAKETADNLSQKAKVLVVDVRQPNEWTAGHIKGAMNIPAGEIRERSGEVRQFPGTVIVTCGGGYRSTVAASVLRQQGIKNIANLNGGMSAWKEAGLPEETL